MNVAAWIGVVLLVVVIFGQLGGCLENNTPKGATVSVTPTTPEPPPDGPSGPSTPPATSTASSRGDLPSYPGPICAPRDWNPGSSDPALLAQQRWGKRTSIGKRFASWPQLAKALEADRCFGIMCSPEVLAKTVFFWNTSFATMALGQWPDKATLLDEDGNAQTVFVFRARSYKAPSWIELGCRDTNNHFVGWALQSTQSGSLTDWSGKDMTSLSGGTVRLYGWATRLHTDSEPGPSWAWIRAWFVGDPDDYVGADKPACTWLPEVSHGQLPDDDPCPWGQWPKEALQPNLAVNGVAFEDEAWAPDAHQPVATYLPKAAPSADASTGDRRPVIGTVTWSSDDLVRKGRKQLGIDIPSRPWKKGQKLMLTPID